MTVVENKWLSGPYAPIPGDVTATELEVIGTLPTELNGRYLRNGPNPITPVDPATHHWFMGDGMVHGVRLRDGRAEWYRNRWVRSGPVADALGEPPHPGPVFEGMDAAPNTNIVRIGPRPGDAAEMVYLELVDFEPVATPFAMRRAERAEEPEAADEE